VRFVAILVAVAFLVGLMWPYLHKFRLSAPPATRTRVKAKFDRFFAAFMVTLIITLVVSTLMLWFGH
jgi:hypothetical protein